ncbi:hypothetical protein V5N11_015548 [Cardamine amara subsp. amara]|uniref:Replication protein A 70 kDa DNA-binding subunit B/D first OB fold domain-containing protein n=1 Tax=Cardamine amara subsp. amara TaxID=228776 RepID=A0ABD0Z5Z0_CARAN
MAYYHDLYRLNTTITGWHVGVKVLRVFRVHVRPRVESLGLILVDEKGEKVEAFIEESYSKYYLEFIEEDRWYTVMKFSVLPNDGPNKLTKSLFKIGFLRDTILKDCDPVHECAYASFTPFCALLSETYDRRFWVELVGYVHNAGELTHVDKDSVDLSGYRFPFVLKDKEGYYVKC